MRAFLLLLCICCLHQDSFSDQRPLNNYSSSHKIKEHKPSSLKEHKPTGQKHYDFSQLSILNRKKLATSYHSSHPTINEQLISINQNVQPDLHNHAQRSDLPEAKKEDKPVKIGIEKNHVAEKIEDVSCVPVPKAVNIHSTRASSVNSSNAIVGKAPCNLTQVIALLVGIRKRIDQLQIILCDKIEEGFQGTFTKLDFICNKIEDLDLEDCIQIKASDIPLNINTPGVYCVVEDLTVPDAMTAISVSTTGVVIDFRDHRLMGGAGSTGIIANSIDNLLIKNARLGPLTTGIRVISCNSVTLDSIIIERCTALGLSIFNSSNMLVKNFQVYNCGTGIEINNSFKIIFDNCTINNGGSGVIATSLFESKFLHISANTNQSGGLNFFSSGNITLEKGCANENGIRGINIFNSRNMIVNHMVVDNNTTGIIINQTIGSKLSDISVNNNDFDGILVFTCTDVSINSGCVNANALNGINSNFSNNISINQLIANNNGASGILFVDTESSTILNSVCNGNVAAGIFLSGAGTLNCHVRNNTTADNASFGILQSGTPPNQVYLNFASGNPSGNFAGGGVIIRSPGVVVPMPLSYDEWIANTSG